MGLGFGSGLGYYLLPTTYCLLFTPAAPRRSAALGSGCGGGIHRTDLLRVRVRVRVRVRDRVRVRVKG